MKTSVPQKDRWLSRPTLARLGFGFVLAAGLLCALLVAQARAAEITVSNTNDSGPGSLRQAIADAASGDTINFSATGIITLTSGELVIDKDLTISGPGVNSLTISGNDNSRVFFIDTGTCVTMTNLTVAGGNGVGTFTNQGGGIYSSGTLYLSRVTIRDNVASGVNSRGGGIYSFGTLKVDDSTVANNRSRNGGGINNGLLGQATISNCTIISNTTDGAYVGGGVSNDSTGSEMEINSSTISDNEGNAGGGVYNEGTLTIRNSTIANNVESTIASASNGGGINNNSGGQMTIINSTVSGNRSNYGGGIINFATLRLHHSTVFSNTAFGVGGYGGGIHKHSSSTVVLSNTLVAGNIGNQGPDLYDSTGGYTSGGYNLIGDATGFIGLTHNVNNDLVGVGSSGIGPLQDNGGPTWTHALITPTLAIDHIPNGLNGCVAGASTDQRGAVRADGVNRGGSACDTGAYEYGSYQRPNAITQRGFAVEFPRLGVLIALVGVGAIGGTIASLWWHRRT